MTDQHLKDLAIALGDRLKLLRAIRELGGTPPIAAKLTSSEPKIQELAERRQVTVLFSDLVGSTALSARMDPEDLREVISAYQKCVAETVRRFGGFVAKYMGDGVLVYFGYPEAHEDDAERAVRAGLELAAVSFQIRVGIATGLVVVGDLIGSGSAQEQAIVGETPNLAARLQGIAAPNTVVIAESTRRLRGNLFELEDLGAKDLKGIAGPMRAFMALRPAAVESRFEALHASGLTALVGREEETDLLSGAGRGPRAARVRWSCFPGKPASANRGSQQLLWRILLVNRIHACATSARPSTPTARFIRSSARWNVRPDLHTTIPRKQGWTSSMCCWRRPRPLLRMPRYLPKCCPCRAKQSGTSHAASLRDQPIELRRKDRKKRKAHGVSQHRRTRQQIAPLRNRHPADELADIRAEIKHLQTREAELRNMLIADGSRRIGTQFEAVILHWSPRQLDVKALTEHFGSDTLAPLAPLDYGATPGPAAIPLK